MLTGHACTSGYEVSCQHDNNDSQRHKRPCAHTRRLVLRGIDETRFPVTETSVLNFVYPIQQDEGILHSSEGRHHGCECKLIGFGWNISLAYYLPKFKIWQIYSLNGFFLFFVWFNNEIVLSHDTVHQTSRGESAVAGLTSGHPRSLIPGGYLVDRIT